MKQTTQTTEGQTFSYIITKDGKEVKRFEKQETDFEPFKYILRNQSQSVNWAIKYEGWKVEEINDLTGERSFWKTN